MWNVFKGKSESSSKDERRKTESTSTRPRAESIVSSSSTRRPTRSDPRAAPPSSRNSYPPPTPSSVASSYATAQEPSRPQEYPQYETRSHHRHRSGTSNDSRYQEGDQHSERRRDHSTSRDL